MMTIFANYMQLIADVNFLQAICKSLTLWILDLHQVNLPELLLNVLGYI